MNETTEGEVGGAEHVQEDEEEERAHAEGVREELGRGEPEFEDVYLRDARQDAIVAIVDLRERTTKQRLACSDPRGDPVEVALHTILYVRQIYPAEFFERRSMFEVPVFQCIEPSVYAYVSGVTKAIGEEIVEDNVAKIIVSVHESETPLEKFVFAVDRAKNFDGEDGETESLPLETIQRQLRAMLLKLNAIDAMLLPLNASDDLSFSFIMQLREENMNVLPDDTFDSESSKEPEDEEQDRESPPIVKDPALIHIIRTGSLNVSLFVQESDAKRLPREPREKLP